MQEWLTKFLKLEQENELLHDMVRKIAVERNTYRIENQRLRDENAMLRRIIERYENGSKKRN